MRPDAHLEGSPRRRLPGHVSLFGLPIVHSKLETPRLPRSYVPRPRVVAALGEGPGNIRVLQAPAGYGKTLATAETVRTWSGTPVAWFSIDQFDSSELSFWVHLAVAIDLIRPGTLSRLSMSSRWRPDQRGFGLAASLLASLSADDKFIIVLDDLHNLLNQTVSEQVGFFIEHLPQSVQLFAMSRTVTTLPLERWEMQGKARTIDKEVLAFDVPEASCLLSTVGTCRFPAEEIARLVTHNEGWVVGLILEAQARQQQNRPDPLPRLHTSPARSVSRYLTREVLDDMTEEDREFLLSIAVLDVIDNQLCRMLTGEPDAGRRLQSLQVANLFIVPIGAHGRQFRLHHCIRELLLDELEDRDPLRASELHRRAAAASRKRGEVIAQVHHLIEAGDHSEAFYLMLGHAFKSGSLATARDLLQAFPEQFLHDEPSRMLDIALMYFFAGDWEAAEDWCDRVAGMLEDGPGVLRARLELYRSWAFGGMGDGESAQSALERSYAAGITEDKNLLALATLSHVRLHALFTGNRKELADWLNTAEQLPPEFTTAHKMTIPALSGFSAFWDGNLKKAESLARRAISSADSAAAAPALPLLEALIVLADVLIESARLSEAAATLQRAEQVALDLGQLAYRAHVEIRRIEHAAATGGASAGEEAAAQALLRLNNGQLGATLADRLVGRHAYWLIAVNKMNHAAAIVEKLRPSPTRSVLEARLALDDCSQLETRIREIDLTTDTCWSAAERIEAELVRDSVNDYPNLEMILAHSEGFSWTLAKQGRPLLDRISSLSEQASETGVTAGAVLEKTNRFAAFWSSDPCLNRFTERERALLHLLPRHLTYAEIASELSVSINTVKANLKVLYRKLNASSRSEAIQRARAANI